jgi:hypothetical protein
MIWDAEDLLESRVQAVRDLPWVIPALTIIEMSDLDLDELDMAADSPGYWSVLNAIVSRIQKGRQHE